MIHKTLATLLMATMIGCTPRIAVEPAEPEVKTPARVECPIELEDGIYQIRLDNQPFELELTTTQHINKYTILRSREYEPEGVKTTEIVSKGDDGSVYYIKTPDGTYHHYKELEQLGMYEAAQKRFDSALKEACDQVVKDKKDTLEKALK